MVGISGSVLRVTIPKAHTVQGIASTVQPAPKNDPAADVPDAELAGLIADVRSRPRLSSVIGEQDAVFRTQLSASAAAFRQRGEIDDEWRRIFLTEWKKELRSVLQR